MQIRRFTIPVALVASAVLAMPLTALSADAGVQQRAAKPAYKVTLKVNVKEAIQGETEIKLKGRVKGGQKGQQVKVQVQYAGKKSWTTLKKTVKLNATGKYKFTDIAGSNRSRAYRVVKPGDTKFAKGISQERQVTVYAWDLLGYRPVGANSGVDFNRLSTIGTDAFFNSLITKTAGTAGFVEYTLGKKCRSLKATYALDDKSATGSAGTISVAADGATVQTYALPVGTIVTDAVIDVTNVFRVRFEMTSTGDGPDAADPTKPDAFAAVGSPQVLCTH